MPWWYARPAHARRLGVGLFELEWALEAGGWSQQYEWWLEAWALEAAQAPLRQAAAQIPRGWRGIVHRAEDG